MPINFTHSYNSAYNTASQYANSAANNIESGRDTALNFLATNLHESVTSTASQVAKSINDSGVAKFLEGYGTSPAAASAAFLGGIGGNLLFSNPLTALVTIAAGTLLTSNRTDLAVMAGTTFASAVVSLAGRAIRI